MPGARRSTEPAAPATGATVDQPPDAERLVSDPETLKALSDPLRLRILEAMVARIETPWSAKELAVRLEVPQTRLYHHLELLVERDLLRVAEQRVVSGIIETRYRVAAMSFRLDHRLLSGNDEGQNAGRDVLHAVFDTSREDVGRALRRHLQARSDNAGASDGPDADPDRPLVTRGLALLTPERAAEFRERLGALIREFESDQAAATAAPWGLLVAFYRQESGALEASHE